MTARRRSTKLTERQKKILQVLHDFQENAGYPPSIREICEETGISSTSVVNYYLDQLVEMGHIERDSRISRGIRLVKPLSDVQAVTATAKASVEKLGQAVAELLKVPVLGRIVAGTPMPVPDSAFAYYDAESMVDVASSLLPERDPQGLFALEVQGDSMIDAMINDGDLVIMKPYSNPQVKNGEMVAVWLTDKDETTLKYYFNEIDKGRIRLQPANPTMGPIFVTDPDTVQVQGKVVMVIRKVNAPVA